MKKLLVTALLIALGISILINGYSFWHGLNDAIGQEKWFSDGTRELIRALIGGVTAIFLFVFVGNWYDELEKEQV